MSSSGCAPPSRPTASPASTACWPNAPRPMCSVPTSISRSRPMTSATPSSTSSARSAISAPAAPASSAWSACSPTSIPRALDLARRFRAAGITVVIGGFHVSGCISMLPELPADLKEALALGITLFAGEGEGRMAALLRDIDAGTLKPIYNYLADMPDMDGGDAADAAARTSSRASPATTRASMPAAAVRSSAASAPSSTCRAASRATARRTTSRRSCAPMPPRASRASSSPTTTSPATATGSRSSTG